MSPLKLTDDELDSVLAAARPLHVRDRDGFLQQVAAALASCSKIGPGTVYRVASETQRKFFDPPELGRGGDQSKCR